METHVIKLNNKLNRNRIDYIEIQDTCDKSGRIKQQFPEIIEYEDKYDNYVTLTSGKFSSLYPNIIKDKNNKFYYMENDDHKVITFTKGAYEVKDINAHIQFNFRKESIKLIVDQGSGRCKVFLNQNYKMNFIEKDTFKDILGFDAEIIRELYTKNP